MSRAMSMMTLTKAQTSALYALRDVGGSLVLSQHGARADLVVRAVGDPKARTWRINHEGATTLKEKETVSL